ncbi:hypothetical protein [Embleya sp. MST-111070]
MTVPEGRRADEVEVRDAFDAAVRRATRPVAGTRRSRPPATPR